MRIRADREFNWCFKASKFVMLNSFGVPISPIPVCSSECEVRVLTASGTTDSEATSSEHALPRHAMRNDDAASQPAEGAIVLA